MIRKTIGKIYGFVIRFLIGFVITVGAIFGAEWIYYQYIDQFTPPELVQPFVVLNENKTVNKGEALNLEVTFKKTDDIFVSSVRQISCLDGTIVVLEPNTAQLPLTEEFKTVRISVDIPENIAVQSGETCWYKVRGVGDINPYRTYTVELYSERFTIK